MANYELVTMRKGEIKSVDSFIINFKTIGANMKALCVSAFNFLTSEDKEVVKDFRCRVIDELNMSKATLSFMKTAGRLYLMNDIFAEFPYTNVVLFDNAIKAFKSRNEVTDDDTIVYHVFEDLAKLHSSTVSEGLDNYKECLLGLSQKELKHLIDIYSKDDEPEVVEDDSTESESTEDDSEDTEEVIDDEVIEEVNDHIVTYYDEEIDSIMCLIDSVIENPKASKQTMIDALNDIKRVLNK